MISGTVTDASGRILSGQTVTAFWYSIRHARPLTVGLNCALGAALMRPYVEEISRIADTHICIYPNAGLPNPMSETGFDELPEDTSAFLKEFAESGFINVVGGCCGTTPDHIRAIAKAVTPLPPRKVPTIPPAMRLSGLEPFTIDDSSLFVNVGERTNVTGSKAFARMILNEEYDNALAVARQQVENGAQIIDINMDEAMLDSVSAMHRFLNLIASEPEISRVPVMLDSSKWEVIEAGLKCLQGKSIVNSISLKNGEEEFIHHAKLCRRYGAAIIVMAFDEKGQPTRTSVKSISANGLTTCWSTRSVFLPKTLFSIRIFLLLRPVSKSITIMQSILSKRPAGSGTTCRMPVSVEAFPTSVSACVATILPVKPSIPFSCITPFQPG